MSCCSSRRRKTKKRCLRKDGRVFKLPRRFTREKCIKGPVRGFSMKSSCAPYKYCRSKKNRFLYNPEDPKRSFDVYIDKDPSDTIPIKYTTIEDVKATITKLERLYKDGKYSHKRIWQVGMIMYVRLKVLKSKKPREYRLAERYFKFLGRRTKIKGEPLRKRLQFKP